jgi:hypothetical protein
MQPKSQPLAIFAATVVVAIGSAMLIALLNSGRGFGPLPATIAVGTVIGAGICLLALWLSFGDYPFVVRLLAVNVGAVPIAFIAMRKFLYEPFLFFEHRTLDATTTWVYAAVNLSVLVVAVLPLVLRFLGARIVRLESTTDTIAIHPVPTRRQFTLRQMFGCMLAVGIIAALIAVVKRWDLDSLGWVAAYDDPGWKDLLLVFATAGAAACAAAWAALGRSWPVLRLLLTAIIGAGLGLGLVIAVLWGAPESRSGPPAVTVTTALIVFGTAVLSPLITGCPLLLWRAAGYRLVWFRRIGSGRRSQVLGVIVGEPK